MPVAPPRELKAGTIIGDTLDVIERCAIPILVFIVALAAFNASVTYYGLEYTSVMQQVLKAVVAFTAAVAATYFLYETVLARTGLRPRGADDAFLPFIGLSILSAVCIMLGLVALVLPGLYLIARWSIAAPTLLIDRKGPIKAMQDSWERTKGSDFTILVAVLLFYGVPTLGSIASGLVFGPEDPLGISLSQLASAVATGLGVAMAAALYGRMIGGKQEAQAAA